MAEIFGRYSLLKHLASGGMAEIWLALQPGSAGAVKPLVIKRILPHLTASENFVEMFLNEARIAAGLNHQNIAHIYDVGEVEGRYFIAMEYVHGVDLRSLYRKLGELKRPLPIDVAIYIVSSICAGLHHAHAKRDLGGRPIGIVHRDVSPQNVLLDFDGGVKLIDFGIAKATKRLEATQDGVIKGKTAYLSPEQARGQALDARSDVFAAGVIFYEMTVGRRPFEAENDYGVVLKIADAEFEPPRAVRPGYPESLEAITLKAMTGSKDKRFSSARELQEALRDWGYENRLRMGPMPLSKLLHEVFPERAATDVASELAAAGTTVARLPDYTGTPSAPSIRGVDRTPGAVSRTGTQAAPPSRSRTGLVFASIAAILLAGVGGGALYVYTNPAEFVDSERAERPVAIPVSGAKRGKKADSDHSKKRRDRDESESKNDPADKEATVKFESDPAEAEVWEEGAKKPLGVTPFEHTLPTGTRTWKLEFRRKGYVPFHTEIVIDGPREVGATLAALTTAAPADRTISKKVVRRPKRPRPKPTPPPATTAPKPHRPKDTPSGRIVDPFE